MKNNQVIATFEVSLLFSRIMTHQDNARLPKATSAFDNLVITIHFTITQRCGVKITL